MIGKPRYRQDGKRAQGLSLFIERAAHGVSRSGRLCQRNSRRLSRTGGVRQPGCPRSSLAIVLSHTFGMSRLWRSPRHECVCLRAWQTLPQVKAAIGFRISFCNHLRPIPPLTGRCPPWPALTTSKLISMPCREVNQPRTCPMLGEWLDVMAVTWVFDAKAAIGSDPTLTAEAKLLKVDASARNLNRPMVCSGCCRGFYPVRRRGGRAAVAPIAAWSSRS